MAGTKSCRAIASQCRPGVPRRTPRLRSARVSRAGEDLWRSRTCLLSLILREQRASRGSSFWRDAKTRHAGRVCSPELLRIGGLCKIRAIPDQVSAQIPIIPDHELLRVIGRGAYGEIWLARTVTGAF